MPRSKICCRHFSKCWKYSTLNREKSQFSLDVPSNGNVSNFKGPERYFSLNGGTSNGYIAHELFGIDELKPELFTAGTSTHRLLCVTDADKRTPFPIIYYKGERSEKTLKESLEDFHKMIDTYLNEDNMFYLVVGDAKTQLNQMAEFGYGSPIRLDINGNLVN